MGKISLRDTFGLIRADFAHWAGLFKKKKNLGSWLSYLFHPGGMAVVIHRFTHYFYLKNWKILMRLSYLTGAILTGSEIVPRSQIGKGFILFHSTGAIIHAKMGEDVIISAHPSIGTDGSKKDIGAGRGCPIIGNKVKIGPDVTIIGPFVIGDGVNILAGSLLHRDFPEYTLVGGSPARRIRQIPPDYSMIDES